MTPTRASIDGRNIPPRRALAPLAVPPPRARAALLASNSAMSGEPPVPGAGEAHTDRAVPHVFEAPKPRASLLGLDRLAREKREERERASVAAAGDTTAGSTKRPRPVTSMVGDDELEAGPGRGSTGGREDRADRPGHDLHDGFAKRPKQFRGQMVETPSHPGGVNEDVRRDIDGGAGLQAEEDLMRDREMEDLTRREMGAVTPFTRETALRRRYGTREAWKLFWREAGWAVAVLVEGSTIGGATTQVLLQQDPHLNATSGRKPPAGKRPGRRRGRIGRGIQTTGTRIAPPGHTARTDHKVRTGTTPHRLARLRGGRTRG